ncbi:type II secretion system protein GspD, partial [bacterium]|nr:type II secretion system protein GspD [bacterium]
MSLDKSRAFGVQAGAIAAGALGKYLQGGGLYDPFNTFGQIFDTSTTSGQAISSLLGDRLADSNRPVTGIALIQALEANGLIY